ncbi:hypothetical protein K402DRAFT_426090 [Aulographum hederae CBS 113979]|uniref:Uncharacterized protein n=1 Tax=Aulographum hederae CBS 113979 TaxID=1176131 RepID=A0A6G1GIN9_9PEZI|nr:hypothetical protein K402DRAFT_426091 [Aulographum hederae CBS 113979]KAF1980607.1 hypothetical protein K402DRAFT_426090 [Aulographum hederae CBS 113979]
MDSNQDLQSLSGALCTQETSERTLAQVEHDLQLALALEDTQSSMVQPAGSSEAEAPGMEEEPTTDAANETPVEQDHVEDGWVFPAGTDQPDDILQYIQTQYGYPLMPVDPTEQEKYLPQPANADQYVFHPNDGTSPSTATGYVPGFNWVARFNQPPIMSFTELPPSFLKTSPPNMSNTLGPNGQRLRELFGVPDRIGFKIEGWRLNLFARLNPHFSVNKDVRPRLHEEFDDVEWDRRCLTMTERMSKDRKDQNLIHLVGNHAQSVMERAAKVNFEILNELADRNNHSLENNCSWDIYEDPQGQVFMMHPRPRPRSGQQKQPAPVGWSPLYYCIHPRTGKTTKIRDLQGESVRRDAGGESKPWKDPTKNGSASSKVTKAPSKAHKKSKKTQLKRNLEYAIAATTQGSSSQLNAESSGPSAEQPTVTPHQAGSAHSHTRGYTHGASTSSPTTPHGSAGLGHPSQAPSARLYSEGVSDLPAFTPQPFPEMTNSPRGFPMHVHQDHSYYAYQPENMMHGPTMAGFPQQAPMNFAQNFPHHPNQHGWMLQQAIMNNQGMVNHGQSLPMNLSQNFPHLRPRFPGSIEMQDPMLVDPRMAHLAQGFATRYPSYPATAPMTYAQNPLPQSNVNFQARMDAFDSMAAQSSAPARSHCRNLNTPRSDAGFQAVQDTQFQAMMDAEFPMSSNQTDPSFPSNTFNSSPAGISTQTQAPYQNLNTPQPQVDFLGLVDAECQALTDAGLPLSSDLTDTSIPLDAFASLPAELFTETKAHSQNLDTTGPPLGVVLGEVDEAEWSLAQQEAIPYMDAELEVQQSEGDLTLSRPSPTALSTTSPVMEMPETPDLDMLLQGSSSPVRDGSSSESSSMAPIPADFEFLELLQDLPGSSSPLEDPTSSPPPANARRFPSSPPESPILSTTNANGLVEFHFGSLPDSHFEEYQTYPLPAFLPSHPDYKKHD